MWRCEGRSRAGKIPKTSRPASAYCKVYCKVSYVHYPQSNLGHGAGFSRKAHSVIDDFWLTLLRICKMCNALIVSSDLPMN